MLGTPSNIEKIPAHITLAAILERLSGFKPEMMKQQMGFLVLTGA